jgi:hypothetical protein
MERKFDTLSTLLSSLLSHDWPRELIDIVKGYSTSVYIIIAGGAQGHSKPLSTNVYSIDCYDVERFMRPHVVQSLPSSSPLGMPKWQKITQLPSGRMGPACCTMGDYLLITGGMVVEENQRYKDQSNKIDVLQLSTLTWNGTTIPMMKTDARLHGCGHAVVDHKWIITSFDAKFPDTTAYDMKTNSWIPFKPMIHRRSLSPAVVHKGKMYVLGNPFTVPCRIILLLLLLRFALGHSCFG